LANRFNKELDTGNFDGLQFLTHGHAALSAGPAGAAICDPAIAIDRAKIAARGHVARTYLKIDAKGFENAAADAIFERIIAEKAKMTWTAAGRDAGQDWDGKAAHAFA